jgi:DNA polymerase I-like protein with 3'-5' exonuclease and polymerase domains
MPENRLGGLPQHVAAPNPDIYWSNNYVVLDFETTSFNKGSPQDQDNRILLACWKTPTSEVQHCWGTEYEQQRLVDAINAADFLVAHNAKFELGWLKRCGIDLRSVITYCTMIGEYVIAGNRLHPSDLSLDKSCARRGLPTKEGPVNWMIKQGWPVEDIPKRWLLKYCEGDVNITEALFLAQRDAIAKLELKPVVYQRNMVTPCLADIEFNGMQLDNDAVMKLLQEEEERYVTLTNTLTRFCDGVGPSKAKQLAEYVYDELGFAVPRDHRGRPIKTATGQYSVAQAVMAKLVGRTKRQQEFLRLYNEWTDSNSNLTKYLRKFGECVEEADGSLHGVFNQCHTRTHRLSSAGSKYRVQFQNFRRSYKPLFRARNSGWLVGEADGAQLEFRIAVHLGRDTVGLRYITDEGSDIHKFTASVLENIPEESVSSAQRTAAKTHTFKPLYGGSSGTEEEQRYYAAFKKQYKGIADTQQRWVHEVLRRKALRTEWGLRYYWPDTRLTDSGYVTNTTSIYNYPVQALATAEIIPIALVCAWHRMSPLRSFLVNTIHDSIIAEVHPDEVADWHHVARTCLIGDVYGIIRHLYGIDLTVPLGAGVVTGTNWGSKDEAIYEAPDTLWKANARREGMI